MLLVFLFAARLPVRARAGHTVLPHCKNHTAGAPSLEPHRRSLIAGAPSQKLYRRRPQRLAAPWSCQSLSAVRMLDRPGHWAGKLSFFTFLQQQHQSMSSNPNYSAVQLAFLIVCGSLLLGGLVCFLLSNAPKQQQDFERALLRHYMQNVMDRLSTLGERNQRCSGASPAQRKRRKSTNKRICSSRRPQSGLAAAKQIRPNKRPPKRSQNTRHKLRRPPSNKSLLQSSFLQTTHNQPPSLTARSPSRRPQRCSPRRPPPSHNADPTDLSLQKWQQRRRRIERRKAKRAKARPHSQAQRPARNQLSAAFKAELRQQAQRKHQCTRH